uniref:Uncharacterized protein n=1 Tax=Caenorhabditis japonica TaxID=281687 RepID=A0A8R1EJF5_CAEJA
MRRKRQIETPEKSAIRKKKDRESRRLRKAAKQAAEERRSVAPNKSLADQERAGKDLEGIKDFRKHTYIEMPECFTFDKTR